MITHDGRRICDMVVVNTKEFARAFNAEILLLRIVEDIPI